MVSHRCHDHRLHEMNQSIQYGCMKQEQSSAPTSQTAIITVLVLVLVQTKYKPNSARVQADHLDMHKYGTEDQSLTERGAISCRSGSCESGMRFFMKVGVIPSLRHSPVGS